MAMGGTELDVARYGVNAGLVAELRERHRLDSSSVDPAWARAFDRLAKAAGELPARAPELPIEAELPVEDAIQHARVLRLIHAYRARGHRIANSDPLGGNPTYFPELDPAHYGFGHADLERSFTAADLPGGPVQTLAAILKRLKATYCGAVGVEYTHVQDPGRKAWLQQRMEETQNQGRFEPGEQRRILEKLSQAELFERFLHTKFVGQKRFSLEGPRGCRVRRAGWRH